MSQSESNHKNVLVEQSTELQQQEFERLNLKELGLQPEDFAQVMDAHQTLTDMTHSSVSEYGKDIATKTST